LFRVDTKRIQLKENHQFRYLEQIKSNRKPIKSDKNLSVAKLGMIKSCIQNEISFIFSKAKCIQDGHIMTEPFRNTNRAI
jgi:hypothetical protein